MDEQTGLTRTEVVVIAAVAFVICIVLLMFSTLRNGYPHPHTPTDYCLSNLRQLSLAWVMYADDNDGKFVNGAAGMSRPNEPAWVGRDWDPNYMQDKQLSEKKQIEAIKAGALYPYCKNEKVFKCPQSQKEFKRTYSIVDSLNGVPQPGNPMERGPVEVMDKLIVKNRGKLQYAHMRTVFICVGWTAPGSYGVYYDKEKWLDPPPVRHRDGANVSFADAHAVYWKWKGQDTVGFGRNDTRSDGDHQPKSPEGKEDLQKVQKAVWGKLGYTPSENN